MADGTTLYLQAPTWYAAGERGMSTDEMTGIQAVERQHPTIPMGPGRVERRAFAYLRHGTLTLIANGAVAPGLVAAPSLGPTRTDEDCVAHLARMVASDPEATRWHCGTDHLHIHPFESLVRFVAKYEGITADLGQKEKHGLLQSLATRAALLAAPTHRMVFHDTPNPAAWMHQMEMWCSILVRQLLKRASCTAVEDLHTQVVAFIEYFHATMAQPFQGTYGRKPLSV
jgi:putative transposase